MSDDLERRLHGLARLDLVIPPSAGGVGHHARIAGNQLWKEAHIV
jgi:hypothetical protein